MKREEFLREIAEIMQLDEVPLENDNLNDYDEWDSMTILGVISFFDDEFNITLSSDDLDLVKTMNDLIQLADDHIPD